MFPGAATPGYSSIALAWFASISSARRERRGAVMIALVVAAAVSLPMSARGDAADDANRAATESAAEGEGWWTPWYLVDYGLIATGTAAYFAGQAMSPHEARIGPVYERGEPTAVFEADSVQRSLRSETVDLNQLRAIMSAPGALAAGIEAYRWSQGGGSAQQFHDTLVGYAEAVAVTAGVTAVTQGVFGRLRPDFGERARNYYCRDDAEQFADHCDGFAGAPLSDEHGDPEYLLRDGRRAFFSGHAAHAFNGFGYASLYLGSRYVWGPDTTPARRAAGISAQASMMALATYISATRVTDARHHTADVVAGAVVGLASANLTYWRRFSLDGSPRGAPARHGLRLTPAATGTGLALSLTY